MQPVGLPAIAWMPPYVAQVPIATTPQAFGASWSIHQLSVSGSPVASSLPNDVQYPSPLIFSFGIEPSMTSTYGASSSPRAAARNGFRNSSPPSVGESTLLCRCTFGRPGMSPSTTSSRAGSVAAVIDTVSPSQLIPSEIHRMCSSSTPGEAWSSSYPGVALLASTFYLPVRANGSSSSSSDSTSSSSPATTSTWTLPQPAHASGNSGASLSISQRAQRTRTGTCSTSSAAPSTSVPAATSSKANSSASGTTWRSRPILTSTLVTRRPRACSRAIVTTASAIESSCTLGLHRPVNRALEREVVRRRELLGRLPLVHEDLVRHLDGVLVAGAVGDALQELVHGDLEVLEAVGDGDELRGRVRVGDDPGAELGGGQATREILEDRPRRVVSLEPLLEQLQVVLRLHDVALVERLELRVARDRDGRLERLERLLLHPVRVAQELDELVLQVFLAHVFLLQQIRGRGSPTSRSITRRPPNAVSTSTIPGGSVFTSPISAAASQPGTERSAASAAPAASGATNARSLPSFATYIASIPRISHAPATAGRTGTLASR